MRRLRIMFILVLSLVFCSTLIAQQSPPRDPQAVAILQRSFVAMGGANLAAIRGTEIQAQVAVPKDGGISVSPATIKTLGFQNFRFESGTSLFIANDQAASIQTGAETPQSLSRRSIGKAGITHLPLLSILADWNEPTMRAEYIGIVKLGNATAHQVRLTPSVSADIPKELESPCEIFIDPQSLLVIKLIYLLRAPGNLRFSAPMEVFYSDYRTFGGIAVPFVVTYKFRGQLTQEYRVTSVSFHHGLQVSDFQPR